MLPETRYRLASCARGQAFSLGPHSTSRRKNPHMHFAVRKPIRSDRARRGSIRPVAILALRERRRLARLAAVLPALAGVSLRAAAACTIARPSHRRRRPQLSPDRIAALSPPLVAFGSCPVPAVARRADRSKFNQVRRVSELASGLTRNQVPRKGLWVRIPCPPLSYNE